MYVGMYVHTHACTHARTLYVRMCTLELPAIIVAEASVQILAAMPELDASGG